MKRKMLFLIISVVLLIFAPIVRANSIWPDWEHEADAYEDDLYDTSDGREDITVCYIYHDETYIYIKIELLESLGGATRILYIYLDFDRNPATGKTGTDNSHDLHDIGADYKIFVEIEPLHTGVEKWNWSGSNWVVSPIGGTYSGDGTWFSMRLDYTAMGISSFPIDVLFISGLSTDYNPSIGHHTYPKPPPPVPLGGELLPVPQSLYMILITALASITTLILAIFKKPYKPIL
jgi:hypothetical protein